MSSVGVFGQRRSVQHAVAEIEIRVATSRAMVAGTGATLDSFFQTHGIGPLPREDLHEVMKEFQCTKWVVTRRAIGVVDWASTLSGGAGYLARSPLSPLYRDVRAGPLMQPFSPNEALEYVEVCSRADRWLALPRITRADPDARPDRRRFTTPCMLATFASIRARMPPYVHLRSRP